MFNAVFAINHGCPRDVIIWAEHSVSCDSTVIHEIIAVNVPSFVDVWGLLAVAEVADNSALQPPISQMSKRQLTEW